MPTRAPAPAHAPCQVDHFVKRRHLEDPVVKSVSLADRWEALDGAQGLELGQREVLRKPAGHGRTVDDLCRSSRGEFWTVRNVGRPRDLVLMTRDQNAVACADKIRLDEVGAERNGEFVAGERMLRPVAGGASVADDERTFRLARVQLRSVCNAGHQTCGHDGRDE